MQAALRAESTAFALIAAPGSALADAAFLRDDLERRGVALRALVLNLAFHVDPEDPSRPIARGVAWDRAAAQASLARAPGGSEEEAARAIAAVLGLRRRVLADDLRAEAALDRLRGGRDVPAVRLPVLAREPCSPGELLALLDAAMPA